MLSFFFDGVPPPEELEATAIPEGEEGLYPRKASRLRRAPLDYSVHGPYSEKRCDLCHESRFSNRLSEDATKLCWSCHEPEDFPGDVAHGPFDAGLCIGCHDPHKAPRPHLLVRGEQELCEECHDEKSFETIDEHRAEKGDDCVECHDPHAAGREYMLKEERGVTGGKGDGDLPRNDELVRRASPGGGAP